MFTSFSFIIMGRDGGDGQNTLRILSMHFAGLIFFFFEFRFLFIGPIGIPYYAVPPECGDSLSPVLSLHLSASRFYHAQSLRCGLRATTFLVFYRL